MTTVKFNPIWLRLLAVLFLVLASVPSGSGAITLTNVIRLSILIAALLAFVISLSFQNVKIEEKKEP